MYKKNVENSTYVFDKRDGKNVVTNEDASVVYTWQNNPVEGVEYYSNVSAPLFKITIYLYTASL